MRVCLVTRHANPTFTPLALLYLKAALVDHADIAADDITILEFNPEDSSTLIADGILKTSPDVLALSCYLWNVIDLMAAAADAKRSLPGLKVIAGGPEVGPIAVDVLRRYPAVDVVVKSEGEIPMIEMTRAWRAGHDIDDVAGIWRRDAAGVVHEHRDATILANLNELSSPHERNYTDPTGKRICVETQRGCVFRCSFCFYNKDLSIRNRRFDLDRVKSEIAYWLDRDIKELYLMDPVFNLNAARAKEICRFIAERNHRRIPIHSEVWAEFIDDEMAALMKAANFDFLEVGLQTTDETALQVVERRLKMAPFLNGIRALRDHGLPFELQLIAGLPSDTVESFCASVDFAAKLRPDYLAAFTLLVLPGTELWRQATHLGLEYADIPPYGIRSTPTISAGEMELVRRMGQLVYRLWVSKTIQALSREEGWSLSRLVRRWIEWQDEPGAPAARKGAVTADQILAFIDDHCAGAGIPSEFYVAMGKLEAGADVRASA